MQKLTRSGSPMISNYFESLGQVPATCSLKNILYELSLQPVLFGGLVIGTSPWWLSTFMIECHLFTLEFLEGFGCGSEHL